LTVAEVATAIEWEAVVLLELIERKSLLTGSM
jgi:hypothetical protein